MTTRIIFPLKRECKKTKVWDVVIEGTSIKLGEVKWASTKRDYAFFRTDLEIELLCPFQSSLVGWGNDIFAFIEEQTIKRKRRQELQRITLKEEAELDRISYIEETAKIFHFSPGIQEEIDYEDEVDETLYWNQLFAKVK